MDRANFFIPITKINTERREVWGWGAIEEPDNSDEILDYVSSKPHFMEWSNRAQKRSGGKSLGNVRAMHKNVAAGKLIELRPDDVSKGFYVGAKIVDDNEWKKIEAGVYTGFSVGGSYLKRWQDFSNPGKIRYTAKPTELSIVDSPCIPSATFEMVKADGIVEEREFQAGNGDNEIVFDFDDDELDKWEEQEHPRADDGKFTSGGGGGKSGASVELEHIPHKPGNKFTTARIKTSGNKVGYIQYRKMGNKLHINEIVVDKEAQGGGIGANSVRQLMSDSGTSVLDGATVLTPPGRKLFERLERDGIRVDWGVAKIEKFDDDLSKAESEEEEAFAMEAFDAATQLRYHHGALMTGDTKSSDVLDDDSYKELKHIVDSYGNELNNRGGKVGKIEIGDVMNKLEKIYNMLDEIENELHKAVPGSHEPIADISLEGKYGSESVEQMPPPSVLLELDPGGEPSQEVLATHAVKTQDLSSEMNAWLPKIGALVKDAIFNAFDDMEEALKKTTESVPERKTILVKRSSKNIRVTRKE